MEREQFSITDMIRKPENSQHSKVEEIRGAIAEVFSNVNLRFRSVLTTRQILHAMRATLYAKHFNQPVLQEMIEILLELKVSGKGRGRDDMTKAIQSIIANEETSRTIREKLLGLGS
jgi:ACT domain-containing protein